MKSGGRFNPKGSFRVCYVARDEETASAEVRALTPQPFVHVQIAGHLLALLDLTGAAVLAALDITDAEIRSPWALAVTRGETPPTHRIGQMVFDAGIFEGLIFPSAERPAGVNVAIFTDRLRPGSWLQVQDSTGLLAERLGDVP